MTIVTPATSLQYGLNPGVQIWLTSFSTFLTELSLLTSRSSMLSLQRSFKPAERRNIPVTLVPQIKYLCMCLSETIFLDNFMKKIYNFINGIEMLHLYGTYEQGEEEEGEVYEVLNIR